jgi:hypothetical protein
MLACAMALGLVRLLVIGAGVDQDDLERRVLEHPPKALRIDKTHCQQRRMHGHGGAERQLDGAEGDKQLHGAGLSPATPCVVGVLGHIHGNREWAGDRIRPSSSPGAVGVAPAPAGWCPAARSPCR